MRKRHFKGFIICISPVSHSVLSNFFVILCTVAPHAPLCMLLCLLHHRQVLYGWDTGESFSSMSSWVKDNCIWKNISIFGFRSIFFCLIIHPLLTSLVLKNKTNVTRVKYYQWGWGSSLSWKNPLSPILHQDTVFVRKKLKDNILSNTCIQRSENRTGKIGPWWVFILF